MEEKLQKILDKYIQYDDHDGFAFVTEDNTLIALREAYILGRGDRKIEQYSKEIDYHISPRQTKINFDGME